MQTDTIPPVQRTLINTQLAAQFTAHSYSALPVGAIVTSPYIAWLLFGFIEPALYDNERKYSKVAVVSIFSLFYIGVVFCYFLILPISIRFLGTYQVSDTVENTITLSSYISTLTTLSFGTGLIFEIPIIALFLAKMRIITADILKKYRRHAVVAILIASAIITPPDILSQIMLTIPIYALYELSIWIVAVVRKRERPTAVTSSD